MRALPRSDVELDFLPGREVSIVGVDQDEANCLIDGARMSDEHMEGEHLTYGGHGLAGEAKSPRSVPATGKPLTHTKAPPRSAIRSTSMRYPTLANEARCSGVVCVAELLSAAEPSGWHQRSASGGASGHYPLHWLAREFCDPVEVGVVVDSEYPLIVGKRTRAVEQFVNDRAR